MNIGQKFAVWIVPVVLIIGLIAARLYYAFEMKEETHRIESLGDTVGQVLERSLDNYMITRNSEALDKTIDKLRSIKSLSKVWLVNRDGVIKASTDNRELGTDLLKGGARCVRCHDKNRKGTYMSEDRIFRWVQPIANNVECHNCHDPSVRTNGVFIVDFNLEVAGNSIKANIVKGLLIFTPALILIAVVLFILTRHFIINRLKKVVSKIGEFKEGNYNAHIKLEGSDEITKLEQSFNEMAEAINTREREKDLLFKQVSTSYDKWHSTFDSITDIISLQDPDCNIITANRAFCEYFGVSIEEAKNMKCHDLFHEGTQMKNCPHRITMAENKPATEEVLDSKNKRIFRISTYPFHLPEMNFKGSIHIAKDITEEKEKEMRLILSDRLAALGQMASGIAHEINNPLASIAGCVEGLLSRVNKGQLDTALFRNYLNIMEEEIIRCKGITTSMLSFVRSTTYERKAIDINNLLDKTVEIIGFQGRLKEIEVRRDYGRGLPLVFGSEGELRQVFLSIITNALDAMKDKGVLTLETGSEKGTIFIKISDMGLGIPQESLGKIFDPFFTTKSQEGGIGLGLSVANKIVTNHSGSIEVLSDLGRGTTFKITLPIK